MSDACRKAQKYRSIVTDRAVILYQYLLDMQKDCLDILFFAGDYTTRATEKQEGIFRNFHGAESSQKGHQGVVFDGPGGAERGPGQILEAASFLIGTACCRYPGKLGSVLAGSGPALPEGRKKARRFF